MLTGARLARGASEFPKDLLLPMSVLAVQRLLENRRLSANSHPMSRRPGAAPPTEHLGMHVQRIEVCHAGDLFADQACLRTPHDSIVGRRSRIRQQILG
jgi:hypothetical protein